MSYQIRTFWSPDKKYLVTAHVVEGEITTLQDDSGDCWEPAGNQQDVADLGSEPTSND